MNKQDFYKRLEAVIGKPLSEFQLEMLEINLKDQPSYITQTEYLDISEVEARFTNDDEYGIGYWLYDKTTKTWIINLELGSHETLTGSIYNIIKNQDLFEEDAAEKYILEHLGFFVSGAMNLYLPIKDKSYQLTDEEKIFDKAKGNLEWRGI